jgi:hypothetical protein
MRQPKRHSRRAISQADVRWREPERMAEVALDVVLAPAERRCHTLFRQVGGPRVASEQTELPVLGQQPAGRTVVR